MLDPFALAKLGRYTLAARLVVDGLFTGQHKSPRKGFSVEFAEHKQYTPGVDPRHLDWKLLARTERLYVKQYDEQTNLRGYVLLDLSESMNCRYEGELTKHQYACFCAATLCHLMQRQQDAFGLVTFQEQVQDFIPPRQGAGHLTHVLELLERTQPAGRTDLAQACEQLAQRLKRRALVIVISDLLGEDSGGAFGGTSGGAAAVVEALGHLRQRKHEVMALQVLDPAELSFPFKDAGRIEDVETGRIIEADPQAIAEHYRAAMARHLDALRRGCLNNRMSYALAQTSQRFDDFLAAVLAQRNLAML